MSIPVAARRCPQCTAGGTNRGHRAAAAGPVSPAWRPCGAPARGGLTAFHLGRAGLRARMARDAMAAALARLSDRERRDILAYYSDGSNI